MFLSNSSRPLTRTVSYAAGSAIRRTGPGLAAGLLGLALLMALAPGLRAQEQVVVPELVNYQGRLESLDTNKTYIDGLYDIDFRIWDSASSTNSGLLWAETYSVYVKGGNFNVILGESGSPLKTPTSPLFRTLRDALHTTSPQTDRYLALTVKEDETRTVIPSPVECAPRQQMLSAPFAFQSQYAQYAASAGAGTFYATNGVQVSGSPLIANAMVMCFSGLTVSGGRADLQNGLQVEGPATMTGGLQVQGGLATLGAGFDVSGQSTLRGNVNIVGTTTGGGFVPVGGIIMWSGSVQSLPSGWFLCDGSLRNGLLTPDLRGRFILGQGAGGNGLTPRNLGDSGGEEKHSLTTTEMPSHGHDVVVGIDNATWPKAGTANVPLMVLDPASGGGLHPGTFHSTTTGGGAGHNTMPPYYVLAFIIRVQ